VVSFEPPIVHHSRGGAVRFIHTADWHLGRLLHGVHLTEDQAHVLDQFVDLVRQVRPHAVLVAGDVYDRAVPPVEAVALLGDTLDRIVRGLGVPVVLIAGNHDSADRLGFGSELLACEGLHVVGPLGPQQVVVTVQNGTEAFAVLPIPYAEPALVRERLPASGVHDHAAAMALLCERARAAAPAGAPSVVVAHAFVAGGAESESERPLSVGGSGNVPAGTFAGFSYVALGHLHRPQAITVPRPAAVAQTAAAQSTQLSLAAAPPTGSLLQYAGSLLPYSFAEADHVKSVAVVEVAGGSPVGTGSPRVELVRLSPRRQVRRLHGLLADILAQGQADPNANDYLEVTLTDHGAIYDAMGRLREVYPNTLSLRRAELEIAATRQPARDHRTMTERELFAGFFQQVTGELLSPDQDQKLVDTLEELGRRDREAV
jgi:DNA repair protein SbcD/Mre11